MQVAAEAAGHGALSLGIILKTERRVRRLSEARRRLVLESDD